MSVKEFDTALSGLTSLLAQLSAHVSKFDANSTESTASLAGIDKALAAARSGTFTVAVVGQMNCGKSTLLNAVLGREVLPAAATACTAKLAEIRRAHPESALAQFLTAADWQQLEQLATAAATNPQPSEQEKAAAEIVEAGKSALGAEVQQWLGRPPKMIPPTQLSDYVAKGGKYTAVTGRVAYQDSFGFDERIIWIDTPGLFDPVRSRELETQRCLSEAAVVVLVLYAGAAFGKEEVDFLRRRLITVGFEKIVVAVNKMDILNTAADRQAVSGYVRQRLADLVAELRKERVPEGLLKALDGATPVPLIGLMGLFGRTRGKMTDADFHEARWLDSDLRFETYDQAVETSGVPGLEAAIHQMLLARDGRTRLADPVRKMEAFLRARSDRLQTTMRENDAARADLKKDGRAIRDEKQKLEELRRKLPDFSGRARGGIEQTMKAFAKRVEKAAEAALTRVADNVRTSGTAAASSGLVRVWEDMMYAVKEASVVLRQEAESEMATLRDEVSATTRQHVAELAADGKLTLNDYYFDSLKWITNTDLPEFDAGAVSQINDSRSWYEKYTPFGRDEAELARERIPAAINAWEIERRAILKGWTKGVAEAINEQYVDPALAGIRDALALGIADKQAALNAIEEKNGLRDREVALLAAAQAIADEQAALPRLLAAAAEIQASLDSWTLP